MRAVKKSYLFRNRKLHELLFKLLAVVCIQGSSQTMNYINNGSFEELLSATVPPYATVNKYWGAADSAKFSYEILSHTFVPPNVPLSGFTYQWPRTGNNCIIAKFFCSVCSNNNRGYPRNRLKQTLKPNTQYCFSMYINLSGESTHAIDGIGAYFGDSNIDTISRCNKPITFLTPQIKNAKNNLITDTLNWVLIQGVFISTGNEKYAMIGNFNSNDSTKTILVNPTNLPINFADYLIDDVSLVELNAPPYAGNDTVIIEGDSVFLGSSPDVGVDEVCVWYKLPGTTPIDTIAGFWIKPSQTSTYVVRQEICGMVKWDTVTIYMDQVGLPDYEPFTPRLSLSPNPTTSYLDITMNGIRLNQLKKIRLINSLGLIFKEDEIAFIGGKARINTEYLPAGVYYIQFVELNNLTKMFIVSRQ